MQRVTSIILDQAVLITQARRGSVLLLNKDGKTLDVTAFFGFDSEAEAQVVVDLSDTLCAEVIKTGEPLMVEDIKDHPELSVFSKGNYQTGSFISLPLQVVRDDGEKQILGVLNLSDKLTNHNFKSNDVRLLNALCTQASIAIANARILDDLRSAKEAQKKMLNELMGIYENLEKRAVIIEQVNKIALSINATLDLEKTFEKICLYAKNLTRAGDALLFYKGDPLSDAEDSIFVLSLGKGSRKIPPACRSFFLEIMITGSPRFINQKNLSDASCLSLEMGGPLAASSFLGVPFFSKGTCIGVVAVTDKCGESEFSDEDHDIIKTLGNQAANAVQNAKLIEEQKTLYFDTISALAAAVDAKDSYTHNHSRDVSSYARAIGEQMGLSEQEMELLQRAAVLHDIGKIAVPGSILNKPDRLTREEFETMKTHVLSGVKIVENISDMAAIIPAMRGHHERYDGTGYPDGLQGEAIPLMARILAVADTYDAITSDRPYRKGPGHDFAVAEIIRCSGSQFAPEVVEAFLKSSVCTNRQPEPVTKP
ncbi:MAG: GAF domain-containing protein, partial [bacterium]|nr:GAF domain-containing protein [bacterium]